MLVRQTIDDTLHEALDVDGLRGPPRAHRVRRGGGALLRHHRGLGPGPRDRHRPALRLPRRRGVPEPAHQRRAAAAGPARRPQRPSAASTRRPSTGCTPRSCPSPTTADDLHDLLPRLVVLRPRDDWRPLWSELAPPGPGADRLARRTSSCGARPRRHDQARRALAGDDDAVASSRCAATSSSAGITTADELAEATTLRRAAGGRRAGRPPGARASPSRAATGRGRPTPSGSPGGCWPACTRYSRRSRRESVEPVTAQDFMRFLLRWQHVAPGTQLAGEAGLVAVLEQLQGYEAAAVVVGAGAAGRAACATTTRPGSTACATTATSPGSASWRPPRDEVDGPPQGPSKATPISVVLRADLAWLLAAARCGDPYRRAHRGGDGRGARGAADPGRVLRQRRWPAPPDACPTTSSGPVGRRGPGPRHVRRVRRHPGPGRPTAPAPSRRRTGSPAWPGSSRATGGSAGRWSLVAHRR